MDRPIVYSAALPQTTDVLNVGKFGMVGTAWLSQALLGPNTVVAGLTCQPTSPTASLNVVIGPGSIYQLDPTDSTSYGDLGVDSTVIMKQGLFPVAQSLTITPPATTGFSMTYLVEAALQDTDSGITVLSYFNSANPAQPFSGPSNSGSSNATTRTSVVAVTLKAGVPAATGSQLAPNVDPGFVGLYTITVANGATQILSGNIVQLPLAPFFPTLPSVPNNVQLQSWVYAGTDTGAANAYVITFGANDPVPTSYTVGMKVSFTAQHANTGASTINVNGLGAVSIFRASGVAVASGDISSGQIVELTYDGAHFQMANYLGSGTNTNSSTVVGVPYVADTGTQNQLIATFSPAITSGQQVAGLVVTVKLANNITGACTINVNGLGVKNVTLGDGTNPPFNAFVAGMDLMIEYDGTEYQIVNTSAGMFYRRPTGNINIYVNTSTGSDTLYDGTSATVTGVGTAGPLKTIGKAMLVAFGYAPSQFSITIQVAAGTYSEAVATPAYAGPNVIINGASTGSVTISSGAANCIEVQGPNTMTVQNLTIQNNGNPNAVGFAAVSGATMTTSTTASNTVGGPVFYANAGGTMNPGSHTFSGGCEALFGGFFQGTVFVTSSTYTFSTPISVSIASALAFNGTVNINNQTPPNFVNANFVSGGKYSVQLNGVITAQTLGVNFLPGTIAGASLSNTGGQYLP
ncbi:hypothetical protein [Bradyrhizobium sp. Tv2a-2]|uniref:hypothetical protein n=1 Tax=Bradyrhizobium sp. Tv2a-2 TaxID=113395 RepID=UPI000687A763|nr:hypothetical protein [Bradyrhizobium sp. Tv2a-2]